MARNLRKLPDLGSDDTGAHRASGKTSSIGREWKRNQIVTTDSRGVTNRMLVGHMGLIFGREILDDTSK